MKTLTLISAYTQARLLLLSAYVGRGEEPAWFVRKFRQGTKFLLAFKKRLQEQEEELEMLRELDSAVEIQMHQCCDEYTKGETDVEDPR